MVLVVPVDIDDTTEPLVGADSAAAGAACNRVAGAAAAPCSTTPADATDTDDDDDTEMIDSAGSGGVSRGRGAELSAIDCSSAGVAVELLPVTGCATAARAGETRGRSPGLAAAGSEAVDAEGSLSSVDGGVEGADEASRCRCIDCRRARSSSDKCT